MFKVLSKSFTPYSSTVPCVPVCVRIHTYGCIEICMCICIFFFQLKDLSIHVKKDYMN